MKTRWAFLCPSLFLLFYILARFLYASGVTFLMAALLILTIPASFTAELFRQSYGLRIAEIVFVSAGIMEWAIIGFLIDRCVSFLQRDERLAHRRCVHCNYDLRGSPGPCCPECGESFPPSDHNNA